MTTPSPAALRAARTILNRRNTPWYKYEEIEALARQIDDATGLPLLIAACRAAREEIRLVHMKDKIVYDPTLVTLLDAALAAAEPQPPKETT